LRGIADGPDSFPGRLCRDYALQVLVVHNSQAADSATVLNAYLAAHPDIPAANMFDLNNTNIVGKADITYTEFVNNIRDPIRNYLDQAGGPSAESIISILLIRGIPHRIQDTDIPGVGDNPPQTELETFTDVNGDDIPTAVIAPRRAWTPS